MWYNLQQTVSFLAGWSQKSIEMKIQKKTGSWWASKQAKQPLSTNQATMVHDFIGEMWHLIFRIYTILFQNNQKASKPTKQFLYTIRKVQMAVEKAGNG